jgi:hypothetical protein
MQEASQESGVVKLPRIGVLLCIANTKSIGDSYHRPSKNLTSMLYFVCRTKRPDLALKVP